VAAVKPIALVLLLAGIASAGDWMPKLHPGGKLDAPWTTAGSAKPDMFAMGRLLVLNGARGSWWETTNSLPCWLQRPFPLKTGSIVLDVEFDPKFPAEQAGMALFYDEQNYVKLVRGFTSQQVIAFCSETAGKGVPDFITPERNTRVTLRLELRGQTVYASYHNPGNKPFVRLGQCRLPKSDKPLQLVLFAQASKSRTEKLGATFSSLEVTTR
jgi:hypothetical protein